MRTASSSGLSALRIIEEEAARGRGDRITLRAGREAAIYLLNKKRRELGGIELRYGVTLEVMIDESFEGARMAVESSGGRPLAPQSIAPPIVEEEDDDDYLTDAEMDAEDEEGDRESGSAPSEARSREEGDGEGRPRRRRRRGGRGRNRNREEGADGERAEPRQAEGDAEPGEDAAERPEREDGEGGGEGSGRNRRGRRGGRGRGRRGEGGEGETVRTDEAPMVEPVIADEAPLNDAEPVAEPAEETKPKTRRRPKAQKAAEGLGPKPVIEPDVADAEVAEKPKRRSRAKKVDETPVAVEETLGDIATAPVPTEAEIDPQADAKPRGRTSKAKAANADAPVGAPETPKVAALAAGDSATTSAPSSDEEDDGEPRRGGWWQRTFG